VGVGRFRIAITALLITGIALVVSSCDPGGDSSSPDREQPTFCDKAKALQDSIRGKDGPEAQNLFDGLVHTVDNVHSPDKDTQRIKPDADTLVKSLADPAYLGGPSAPPVVEARKRFTKFIDNKCGTSLTGKVPDNGSFVG